MNPRDRQLAIDAYLEAVAFTEMHSDNPELEGAYFSDQALTHASEAVDEFWEMLPPSVQVATVEAMVDRGYPTDPYSWGCLGHDLWLTRNGHGAGFWDRDLGELGSDLTLAAQRMGEVWVYCGEDGLAYVH